MDLRARRRDDRGETLVELMVAMTILGTGVVALVGGIGTSIVVSDLHREQATAGAALRTYAEAIQTGIATGTNPYVPCASPADYEEPAAFEVPSGYTAAVTSVLSWNGSTASMPASSDAPKGSTQVVTNVLPLNDSGAFAPCASGSEADSGIQRLTIMVTRSDVKTPETLAFVIRKPCRSTDAGCS